MYGIMQTVSSVEWHRKGDYFSTLMPADILFPFVIYIFILSGWLINCTMTSEFLVTSVEMFV